MAVSRPRRLAPSWAALCCATLAIASVSCIIPSSGQANPSEVAVTTVGNLAMGGFDPLTFTNEEGPSLGSDQHRYYWKGANWQFVNRENRDIFRAEPERYAPAYGGHGAWAVSVGEFLKGDPRLYLMIDGQLYLFFSEGTLSKWLDDPEGLKRRADREWAAMLPDMN
ncbi:MAG: YHS domain-containing (seleno)protein [Pseudomonadota bacterium]